MWYLSSRKGHNFKHASIFSLLAFVNHSPRCSFLPGYCRINLGPSIRFVILQAVNMYVFVARCPRSYKFYAITFLRINSFSHTLMTPTPHAQVWKAAPEEERLSAKLPVLDVTVLSAGQKKNRKSRFIIIVLN